jgi:hypothetical protein
MWMTQIFQNIDFILESNFFLFTHFKLFNYFDCTFLHTSPIGALLDLAVGSFAQ